MSELSRACVDSESVRLRLKASASMLALLSIIWASQSAALEDEDGPTVWIELGGQLERVNGTNSPLSPAFLTENTDSTVFKPTSPLQAQHSPRFSFGEEAKISFRPRESNWIISAAVRYGRSNGSKDFEYQTNGKIGKRHFLLSQPPVIYTHQTHSFSEVQSQQQESRLVLDFQAGKDVGLGFWGMSSDVHAGVRYAQFTSKAEISVHARPEIAFYQTHPIFNPQKYLSKALFHAYVLAGQNERSFQGIGPSLSWNGSIPVIGGERDARLDLDLGLSGALLFGRQKAKLIHQTTARYFKPAYYHIEAGHPDSYRTHYVHNGAHARSRSVVVPNVEAFAGLSYRIENFKMSAGYRADFFFGAMDTDIDSTDRTTTSFHGPFATVSIGIGR